MKILYITPDITDSGGISRVVSLKANYLVSHLDYEISIVSVTDSYPNCFYDFDPAIKWVTIKKSKNIFFFRNYFQLIKKTIVQESPSVIVVCDAVLWVFIPWFVKTKTPIVFETHVSIYLKKILNNSFLCNLRFEIVKFFKAYTLKKFDKFIVLSEEALKEWNVDNCKVIPNPISFITQNQANLENKIAIAVCRHSYEKGVDRLLLIWKRILEYHPDWRLDIYGEWDSTLLYQKMAETLKICKSVNFIAPTNDIQKKYNQSSILLMASRSEAFPMVLLEAMTTGLPCIAYDCPIGPKAIIENAENGFLIEDNNIDLFVEKLNLLIEDKNLRLTIGQKANHSAKKYNIDEIMKKWDELFTRILSKND